MVYLIGFIVSAFLWLYTVVKIFEKNDDTFRRVVYTLGIIIFPMFGVLYAIYDILMQIFKSSDLDENTPKLDKDPYHRA